MSYQIYNIYVQSYQGQLPLAATIVLNAQTDSIR